MKNDFAWFWGYSAQKVAFFEPNKEINWLMGYFGNKIASQNLGFERLFCGIIETLSSFL